jgi:hypothetical protein
MNIISDYRKTGDLLRDKENQLTLTENQEVNRVLEILLCFCPHKDVSFLSIKILRLTSATE